MRTTPRRLRRAGTLALLLTVVLAAPAAADPPGPTNYEARVVGLEPPTELLQARVLGGDSFLQLTVAPGHEVLVRGYDGEELYLRFDADGTVHENVRSRSWFQNQDRYAATTTEIPSDVGASAPPEWVLRSTDGSYAWHDHRIHWMSPATLPFRADDGSGAAVEVDPTLGEPQLTTVWVDPIPVVLDGEEVGIRGEVVYLPDASPIPTAAAALLGLAAVLALGWAVAARGIVAGVGLAAASALAVSLPQVVGLATGVQAQPLQLVLPLVGALVVAAGLSVRTRSPFALAVAGFGGAPLIGWALGNIGAVTAPVVPSGAVPDVLVRVAVGLALGAGVAAIVLGVRDVLTGDALSLDVEGEPARG